ncbi:MAG: class I SAM-dependent methyltransferase [Patescibacteria group bacterium]
MKFHKFFAKLYQKASLKMCEDCSDFIKKGDSILDLGCGSGIVIKTFGEFFNSFVTGIDIQDSRLVSVPFKLIKEANFPFQDLSFDVILISYVLHHAKNQEDLLKEAKRVAKRIIVFEDLPEKGFFSRIRCFFHGISYNNLFQKKDQKFHFRTKKEWEELFSEIGFKVIATKKVGIPIEMIDPTKKILFILESK